MKKILDKRNMSEQMWQAYREQQEGIGGSEVATILNCNPFKSKFVLWLEKTNQVDRPKINNQFIEWGNLLEPVIREKFKQETGFQVYKNNFVLQHDEHDFMIANLDGEVRDPQFKGRGVLEIKTTSSHNLKDWEKGCPIYYQCQVMHYLAVTGYEYAYICCLIGGNTFKYYLIERDEYIIDRMIQAEMEFMNQVKKRIPPDIGGSSSESEWLAATYPMAIDEERIAPYYIEQLAKEYLEIQEEIKAKTARADEIKNQIKLESKEIKILKGESIRISMPTINKTIFDSKTFSLDHPELYAQYKNKESSYRGFNVSLLK
jgi:putative phage-type endonuclease